MSTSEADLTGFVPIPDDQLFKHAERVKDKVVVITGAASGIGRESAIRFASFGAKIVIGDLDLSGAESTVSVIKASGGEAVALKCNVTSFNDQVSLFDLAIETYGFVDIVVPNAGIGEPESFFKVIFDKAGKPQKPNFPTIQVNLIGALYTVHLAQHYLLINKEPDSHPLKSIVLMGSMSSWSAFPPAPIYSSGKHAILGLMRSLEPVLALKGIRIACITPFFADTAIIPILVKGFLAGCPLTPVPRIAGAIIYAASHPDPATTGTGYLLPDDGPVFQVPKERFQAGVYKLLDERANSLLKGVNGIAYIARFSKDITKIVAKPLFTAVIAMTLWAYRNNLKKLIKV